MKRVFDDVKILDKRAVDTLLLSEDILMEHAATSIYEYICKKFKKNKSILIVCGAGNNGADGIALARLLHTRFDVKLYLAQEPKTNMAILQKNRAKAIGVNFTKDIFEANIVVDALFGTGLNKPLNDDLIDLIKKLNDLKSFKIACDTPSGIDSLGNVNGCAFKADVTITMGALKTSLFSDIAKDYVGKIKIATLGVEDEIFQDFTNKFLLQKSDLKLPLRRFKNSHKGHFGHLNVICGDKLGASIIASNSAFAFGCALVTVICEDEKYLPYHLMQSKSISKNCTAIAIGMGLGDIKNRKLKTILEIKIPKVLDADIFYNPLICDYLDEYSVLTPHPKEFVSLLKISNIANISVETLQKNRFFYVKEFCKKYPKTTLLLKGANVIISQNEKIFINNLGSSKLSKGGSGDVLSGIIASLLAQGYTTLEACINGSLAHTLAAKNYKKNNYSLSPQDLINEIKKL